MAKKIEGLPVGVITQDEAARRLGLKPHTLRNWRLRGIGPAFVRIGRYPYYLPEDIDSFVRSQRVVPQLNRPRVA